MTLAERRGFDVEVYEPAEDSSLLATAIADSEPEVDLVLDVGTGSGFVGERVAAETGARVVGTDVNPHACRRARDRGIETVRADLVGPFRAESFDAVFFNPPYLPGDPSPDDGGDEEGEDGVVDWLDVATLGGETGRDVIERFVDDVGRVLVPDGAAFLLVSSLTGVGEVVDHAAERGFSAAALEDVSFPGETLTVLKLVR